MHLLTRKLRFAAVTQRGTALMALENSRGVEAELEVESAGAFGTVHQTVRVGIICEVVGIWHRPRTCFGGWEA